MTDNIREQLDVINQKNSAQIDAKSKELEKKLVEKKAERDQQFILSAQMQHNSNQSV